MTINFTKAELTRSAFAFTHNLDNTPNAEQLDNLQFVAQQMERIRFHCGNHPIIVTSGFRNYEVNKGVGGSPTSAHLVGLAVDFYINNKMSMQHNSLLVLECIYYFDQMIIYDDFIHLSFDRRFRRQLISKASHNR